MAWPCGWLFVLCVTHCRLPHRGQMRQHVITLVEGGVEEGEGALGALGWCRQGPRQGRRQGHHRGVSLGGSVQGGGVVGALSTAV